LSNDIIKKIDALITCLKDLNRQKELEFNIETSNTHIYEYTV